MNRASLDQSPECVKISLEFEERVGRYMFNKYGSKHPIIEMMFQMKSNLKPFPVGARVSINIPVAGHQESKNIYGALLSYSEQGGNLDEYAGWDTFEINLFLNTPEPTPENPYDWDATFDEINRFRNDFPHIHINVVARRLPKEYLDIGIIRGIITDLNFFRSGVHPDHIIISHDADQVAIHPTYIRKIIEKFEDPNVQIFGGKAEEDAATYLNHPELFVIERFKDFQSRKIINTPGVNSAYRASAYIRVGGYHAVDGKCGEDNNLGQRIAQSSWDKKTLGYCGGNGRALRVVTSGRRMVDLLMKYGKIPGNHAWEEVYEDGTSGVAHFGPDDAYRNLQVSPDISKLSSILQDDASWSEFLKTVAPHIFQKIHFHRSHFHNIEHLVQTMYGADNEKKHQIGETFQQKLMVLGHDVEDRDDIIASCPLVSDYPLRDFPENARRSLHYLGVEEIDCKVAFYPYDPMGVFVDIQITRADKMRAGLQKFLEKMKAQYPI